MRIALVSPYSWTYPGGVNRHVAALATTLDCAGHEVRVLAPYDPPDRLSARLHAGAQPQAGDAPDFLVGLGRTIGVPMNGAVSNLAPTPGAITTLRRELRAGRFDVVHVHEPVAPVVGWDALMSAGAPLVGTFHAFSENAISNNVANLAGVRRRLNQLRGRIAVSEAAEWTARRFYGGEYRIVPNGVDLAGAPPPPRADGGVLRLAFVGQSVERKGLGILLRAFEALRERVPVSLTVVGADFDEVAPLMTDAHGMRALGKVDDAVKRRVLEEADVLCAPSLGGESFGMVLTEAFAAGTPVVASDIAGYRDVVKEGCDGMLVPRGDAVALAEALYGLWLEPARRARLAAGAARAAEHFAWPRVAEQVVEVYEEARAVPVPARAVHRLAVRGGLRPPDLGPRRPPVRLPSPEPAEPRDRRALPRRIAMGLAGTAGLSLAALAVHRIGLSSILEALLASSPFWVLAGLAVMCASMFLRATAWHAILRAALPATPTRLVDAVQGTFIGVLMSATLPARLGEPSRAFIVARRTGRPRDTLPTVLGTLVSQTLLNIVALVILGVIMFSTVGLFAGNQGALVLATIVPVVLGLVVLVGPAALRGSRAPGALRRARAVLAEVRRGLSVFREPRLGGLAAVAQLSAWVLQCGSCYLLLVALGLDERAGFGAAAAVLFAVNVTAVLPVTPSNLGVFQAACVAVLTAGYGVGAADALGYGIILQAVEGATAVAMGMPALVKEGLSWRDVRLRALYGAPVTLQRRRDAVEAEA